MVTANIEFEKACKALGLDARHASVSSINKAYRSLAKKYHPDKNPGVDPNLFVRITDAKNTALKHANNDVRGSSPHAKPLKLEIVPSEIDFKNIGRREIKSRDFVIYSTGGPFTRFSIDRKHLPRWLHISSVTRTTNQELPVRVTVRVTGPETGDHLECHIPVKIENKDNCLCEETRVHIKLNMKEPKLQLGCKSFEFSTDRHGLPRPQILTLTNVGAGQIKGDLHPQEQWIAVEPAHVSFHNRQLVKIRIDASKLSGRNSGYINLRTNVGEETVTVQTTVVPRRVKATRHGQVDTINVPNILKWPAYAGTRLKDWKAPGSTAPNKASVAKPHKQPLQKSKLGDIVKAAPRKAALAVSAAVSGLFLFSIICIASASPPSNPSTMPYLQAAAPVEQTGKLKLPETILPATADQAETLNMSEVNSSTVQPTADDLTSTDNIRSQPVVNQYWSAGSTSGDNIISSLTYSTVPSVTTGESAVTQQNGLSNIKPGKNDAKPGQVNKVKKKDGKIRQPLQYVDIEGPRNRFNKFTNPRLTHPGKEIDN